MDRHCLVPIFFVFVGFGAGSASLCQEATHAPDHRAPQYISPLYFGPKANAPFAATAKTEWVKILPDNSTVTAWNQRSVARDMDGRIFQERTSFVPQGSNREPQVRVVEYSDPLQHTIYTCNTDSKTCNLHNYFPRQTAEQLAPEGLQKDGTTYLTRENLGTETYEGIEVERSRETFTFYKLTIGNTRTILRTVEYWYSPALDVNLKVARRDPRDGDQTLWLTDITMSAPAPETFEVPGEFRVYDRRVARPNYKTPEDQPQQ